MGDKRRSISLAIHFEALEFFPSRYKFPIDAFNRYTLANIRSRGWVIHGVLREPSPLAVAREQTTFCPIHEQRFDRLKLRD